MLVTDDPCMWWMLVVGYVVGEGAWMPNLFLLNLASLLLVCVHLIRRSSLS